MRPRPGNTWAGILGQWQDDPDQTQRERQWINYLHGQLGNYFHVRAEVEGINTRGETRRIDLLCTPKAMLKNNGFNDCFFGVECKYPLVGGGLGWVSKWGAQMIDYAHTSFYHRIKRDYVILPDFILSSPPLSDMISEYIQEERGDGGKGFVKNIFHAARIGELNIRSRKPYDKDEEFIYSSNRDPILEIIFGGQRYWDSKKGRSATFPGKHIFASGA